MGDDPKGKKLPQYIAALSVCMGSVAAGAVLGWTSNITEELSSGEYNELAMDEEALGWIGSLATLGALAMCIPIGIICDKIGRKWAMLLLVIPFMLGWLLIIFAENLTMIYVGRFILGASGGAFCVSAPMYTSEIAQPEIRGALGSYFQLLLTVGILFAYVVASIATPKVYTIICAILPLVFAVCFFFQPETPLYLLKKGDDKNARLALVRLRGSAYDVDAEIKQIKVQLDEDAANQKPFLESFKSKAAKKASLICFGLMFFQQLSGINAVIFYTGYIFQAANIDLDSKIATIIVGIMQVGATFASTLIIDRLGRKVLLFASGVSMAVSVAVLGLFFTLKDRGVVDNGTIQSLGFLPVLALCIFIVVFSLGYGPIPWMISSELFPPEIKTVASSSAGCFNWFLAFLVTKFYLNLNLAIGGDSAFYIFAGVSALGSLFIVYVVPETKNKTLEQIQRELNGEKTDYNNGIDNKAFSS